jgi:enoyl-CoA hydratase/carnithine racemase
MAETTYETIIVRRGGGAVRVILNRPEKKNAVNAAMFHDLSAVMADISRREEDRVLVLSGAGGAFNIASGDAAEARDALQAKRAPRFTGRWGR